MQVFYLENMLAGKSPTQRKYYTGHGDMENDASSNNLDAALFYINETDAINAIETANSWWEAHDYRVMTADLEDLLANGLSSMHLYNASYKNKKTQVADKPVDQPMARKITVVIEGTDGVGKSTVIKALDEYFNSKSITERKRTDITDRKLEFEFLDREKTAISASMLFTVRMKDRVERIRRYLKANPDTLVLFLVNEDANELMRRIKSRNKPISDFDDQAPAYNLMYMATFREMERNQYVGHQLTMVDVTDASIEAEKDAAIGAIRTLLQKRALAIGSRIKL